MPRVNYVTKARKDQGACGRCRKPIPVGAPYKYIEFRYGGRHVRCDSCTFRPSEMTQSKLSSALAAREDAEDAISEWDGEDIEDLRTALDDCATAIKDCGQEYRDSADTINQTAEGSSVAADCEEKADALEGWGDEIESAKDNLEDWDGDEEPEEPSEPEDHHPECASLKDINTKCDCDQAERAAAHDEWEAKHEEWKTAHDEWVEAQREAAVEALGECPC